MNERNHKLDDLRIDRSEQEERSPRLLLALVALLLLGGAAAAAWFFLLPRAAEVTATAVVSERPSEQRNGSALRGTTVLDASGYVVARLRATVSSKITGKLEEVLIEEGMAIEEGQVLARLDNASQSRQLALVESQVRAARERLKETEVRIAEAELDLQRTRALVESEVVGQARLDSDQAELDSLRARLLVGREDVSVAEQQVGVARQALDDTVIRAPFAGVAVTKDAQPGEMISPVSAGGGFTRTGICTLVDMSSLEIEVDVNEAYINRVRTDQPVQAVLDAYPDWKIPAHVITTVPTADRQRATVRVRVGFEALDPRLLPEMGVKVSFLEEVEETPEPDAAADASPRLYVDAQAVRTEGDEQYVLLVAGGRAQRRGVVVGPERGGRHEVVSGLAAGDRVVTDGPPELADGDAVRTR